MMKLVLTIFSFLSMGISLYASAVDTSWWRSQYDIAFEWNQKKDFDQAMRSAQSAVAEIEQLASPPTDLLVGFYNILGDCSLESGQFGKALEHYNASIDLLKKKGFAESPLMVETLNKLGNFYAETKEFKTAERFLQEALDIASNRFGNWHLKVADIYINLGRCHNYFGDFEKSLDYHQQALAIRKDLQPDVPAGIAQCYNNIAICLEDRQDYKLALEAYRNAIDNYRKAYGDQHQDLADVYLNMGNTYGALAQLDTFIHYQTKALNIWRNIYGPTHPLLALAYNNLANAYDELGQTQKAFQLFGKALDIRTSNYGSVHPDVAQIHFNMGLSYSLNEKWQLADQSFAACFKALNHTPGHHTEFEEVNDPILLLRLLYQVPEIPVQYYQDAGVLSHLLKASSYYEEADRLIDYLRTRYQGVDSKLILAEIAQEIYDDAIEIALFLAQLTKNDHYLRQAFQFSEKSKGLLLLEALRKTEAAAFSGISAGVIDSISAFEQYISELEKQRFLESRAGNSLHSAAIDSLNNLLFQQKQQLSALISRIEQAYPQYYNLRYATSSIPVNSLQKNLIAPDQTIVEYFLGSNYLRIFLIDQDQFKVKNVRLPEDFDGALHALNAAVRNFPFVSSKEYPVIIEQYAKNAHYLYNILIEPVKDDLNKKLTIIPGGSLGFLSFEMLLSKLPSELKSFADLPFLLREHTISYSYSTGLYKEMMEASRNGQLKNYLGFAPIFHPGNQLGLNKLKYNREEISEAGKKFRGRTLFNAKATKSNFLKAQAKYKILHLATHGKANSDYGDYSFLAFSEDGAATGKEALLYVREIYSLQTNAELVVLSACQTGTGELYKGEGISSIARSFSYAGAKSLVASHWSVDDQATSRLMGLFFDNIRRGMLKDEALQNAKISFISSSGNKDAHPYYWASFIPIGNMETISLSQPVFVKSWFFLNMMIISVLVYIGRIQIKDLMEGKCW